MWGVRSSAALTYPHTLIMLAIRSSSVAGSASASSAAKELRGRNNRSETQGREGCTEQQRRRGQTDAVQPTHPARGGSLPPSLAEFRRECVLAFAFDRNGAAGGGVWSGGDKSESESESEREASSMSKRHTVEGCIISFSED